MNYKMEIENFGAKPSSEPRHHPMLPDDIRMLVVGQSGCGKTNLVVNLILIYKVESSLHREHNSQSVRLRAVAGVTKRSEVQKQGAFCRPRRR